MAFTELPKRTRYYQSMIDLEALERSADYRQLPGSYVIFISLDNPFLEYGLHKYTFTSRCEENTELRLEDGAKRIFISAEGDKNDVSDDMKSFLRYLTDQSTGSALTRRLEEEVRKAKSRREWSVEYMTLYEKMQMEREAGMAEGKAEGTEQAELRSIEKLISRMHLSLQEAMDVLDIDPGRRERYAEMIEEKEKIK